MKNLALCLLAAIALAMGFSTVAETATITGTFTGLVTSVDDWDDDGVCPTVSVDDPVVGLFSYRTELASNYLTYGPPNYLSIWQFPAGGLTLTATVGEAPGTVETWTVRGGGVPAVHSLLRVAVQDNLVQDRFSIGGKASTTAEFPLVPDNDPRKGWMNLDLISAYHPSGPSPNMVTNGGTTLPTAPSHINATYAASMTGFISGYHGVTGSYGCWGIGFDLTGLDFFGTDGSTVDDPLLPVTGGDGDPFGFEDMPGDGKWFDPPPASGYLYQTDGASNFTSVGFPPLSVVGDADGSYTVTSANGSVTVAADATHTFGSPVDSFTVSGIDPAVDGGDPLAFPTFLAFDQPIVSFTMNPVPEPSSFVLATIGLLGLVFYLWRRRR